MGFLDKYKKDEIEAIIKDSKNFAEVLIKMGKSANSGSNRMVITQYAKDNHITTEHFVSESQMLTPKEIFIEHSLVPQITLRKHYKRGKYSEYKCAICGLEPWWNGQELVLTLDHKNGISNDHRLENLRWICPNCDRQLPTYGSKRFKKEHFCSCCGKQIRAPRKSGMCKLCYTEKILKDPNSEVHQKRIKQGKYKSSYNSNNTCKLCGAIISPYAKHCKSCSRKLKSKAKRPDSLTLAAMIKESGFRQVSKNFGVSDQAIQKWCKSYGIPHTKKELVAWYDQQMGIIAEPAPKKKKINEIVRPVKQINITTGQIENIFPSQAAALRFLGKSESSHIRETCQGKRQSAYGYYWQFADE